MTCQEAYVVTLSLSLSFGDMKVIGAWREGGREGRSVDWWVRWHGGRSARRGVCPDCRSERGEERLRE
jgi:hypothetical protein